jgi:hypothetical protein
MTSQVPVEVNELAPGEYRVRRAGRTLTAIVPAGVGLPGVADEDLVAALVRRLVRQGHALPDPLDVSAHLAADPGLVTELDRDLNR